MSDFRTVTDDFAVSPQLGPAEVRAAAAQGYAMIINNRPNLEAPDQPMSAEIEAAALAAGLRYAFVPVVGRPTREQVQAVRAAAASANGKVLAFCRSGTRSIIAWAMGEIAAGTRTREEVARLSRQAGYDLTVIL